MIRGPAAGSSGNEPRIGRVPIGALRKLLFCLLLLAPLTAPAAENVLVHPAPPWIDRVDVRDEQAPADVRNGIWGLLTDHQVRVDGARVTDYYRNVRKVATSAGVQDASELSIDFDPSYETLILHEAAVIRDGKRMNELNANELRVIEKEPESNDRIYDGQLSALLFLRDVRPGDLIDYSYSLDGANPLLGGKYADDLELSAAQPTKRIRHRLLWPAGRPLQFKLLRAASAAAAEVAQPAITRGAVEDVYVWQREDPPVVNEEDEQPAWFDAYDTVQVTEFRSWAEVAQWAGALYNADAKSVAAVHEIASRIEHEETSQDARITAAIRFVQDDIRYLGIEMGRNSHEPHQPSLTLAQRYGDCKDKAFLLCMLLHELGVDARPAMVNTKWRHRLDDYLPSPFVFDHVIARVAAGGRTYWIDGTIAEQGGRLATIETPNDERALVIDPATTALARIATAVKGGVVIEQAYDASDETRPVTMTVTATYQGRDADDLRARLATTSIADVGREHLNRYAADQPKIEALGAPSVSDNREANVIVLREHYRVRDLFASGTFRYSPRSLELFLKRPETMIRTTPLAFDYPLHLTQRATFRLPRDVSRDHQHEERTSPAFRYVRDVEANGRQVVLTYRLESHKDAVAVADIPRHLTALNDVLDDLTWPVTPHATLASAATLDWGFAAIAALVALLTWTLGRLTARRRTQDPGRTSH